MATFQSYFLHIYIPRFLHTNSVLLYFCDSKQRQEGKATLLRLQEMSMSSQYITHQIKFLLVLEGGGDNFYMRCIDFINKPTPKLSRSFQLSLQQKLGVSDLQWKDRKRVDQLMLSSALTIQKSIFRPCSMQDEFQVVPLQDAARASSCLHIIHCIHWLDCPTHAPLCGCQQLIPALTRDTMVIHKRCMCDMLNMSGRSWVRVQRFQW